VLRPVVVFLGISNILAEKRGGADRCQQERFSLAHGASCT
jgi:hypothetical protein